MTIVQYLWIDDDELKELFNENPIQTQEKLAKRLGVQTNSIYLIEIIG